MGKLRWSELPVTGSQVDLEVVNALVVTPSILKLPKPVH